MTTTQTPTPTTTGSPYLTDLVARQRAAFLRDGIPDVATRVDRLDRLEAMLVESADALTAALDLDFGTRSRELSLAADVVGSLGEIQHQRKHVAAWTATTPVAKLAGRIGLSQRIRHDPKGVVGIIGPWNFPVQLVVVPAASALAAGNRVVLRPSEVTAATAQVLADAAPRWFSEDELAVVTQDQADGPAFVRAAWDHLFFTGSTAVGRLVAEAAGRNLVPVTLELGGKNPAVVDRAADVQHAAARLADARMVNSGQVCVCPDYVLVPREHETAFVDAVLATWRDRMTSVAANDDVTSIVDDRNFARVVGLVDDAVARGAVRHAVEPHGERLPDPVRRKVPPTVLTGVAPGSTILEEEVFGPVLTVHPYDDLAEAIDRINAGPSPLTIYWLGEDDERFEQLQAHTRSGSVNGNDFGLNMINPDLPFGGVGASGYGAYHGKAGFETFSHARTVVHSRMGFSLGRMMAPPFRRRDALTSSLQLKAARRKVAKRAGRSGQ